MTSAERLAQYEDLFTKSQAFNPAQFQQEFEKGYGETTNYNKDLIQQQSNALGELQSVAPKLRERYSNTLIKDPTLQRSLIAQARQAPISDYSNAVNLLGQRGQRYADVLQSALGGYEVSASQAQSAAENAWMMYQDQLAQEQAAQARASSGGSSLSDILASLLGGGTTDTTESYEIPVEEDPFALGDSWPDRLTQQVLDQRKAQGFGDVVKSYVNTSLEPYKNLKTFGDFMAIPSRAGGALTTVYSDLFNRIF